MLTDRSHQAIREAMHAISKIDNADSAIWILRTLEKDVARARAECNDQLALDAARRARLSAATVRGAEWAAQRRKVEMPWRKKKRG